MDYTITYRYKGIENTILLEAQPSILAAIGQFYEDYKYSCEILKIEQY